MSLGKETNFKLEESFSYLIMRKKRFQLRVKLLTQKGKICAHGLKKVLTVNTEV